MVSNSLKVKPVRLSWSGGQRNEGGGRTGWLKPVFLAVGDWASHEKQSGHFVDTGDLWIECEVRLRNLVQALEHEEASGKKLNSGQHRVLEAARSALKVCTEGERASQNQEKKIRAIRKYSKLFVLKPQRLLSLSLSEEARRAQCTWMCKDERLWVCCFGDEQDLSHYVSDAARFIEHREDTVLIYTDQVPFNAKVSSGKQVYAQWESSVAKGDRSAKGNLRGGLMQASQVQFSEEDDGLFDVEGMFQTRGSDHCNADKFRITLELMPKVYGWCKGDGVKPVTRLGTTLAVLTGTHARASNISRSKNPADPTSDRFWIKDESFVVKGKAVHRKAGEKVGKIMFGLLNLRDFHPECAQWFEVIDWMQQPAGFCDAVICVWRIEAMAKEDPQSLVQRDLFTGALTLESKEAMRVAQSVPCWIAGKMTAALQLVDTDLAHRIKNFARAIQDSIRRDLRNKAESENTPVILKCGIYEIAKIVFESHVKLSAYCDETEVILHGLRRNCLLSKRPDYEQGMLVAVEDAWAVEYPEGSHRIKASWHQHRQDWVDENGKPLEPQWKAGLVEAEDDEYAGPKGSRDQAEDQYHGPEGSKVKLESWKHLTATQKAVWGLEEPEHEEAQATLEFDEHASEDYHTGQPDFTTALSCMRAAEAGEIQHTKLHPLASAISVARLAPKTFDPLTTSQKKSAKTKAAAKAVSAGKIKAALRTLSASKKEELDKAVKQFGRRKTLEHIIPGLSAADLSKKKVKTLLKDTASLSKTLGKLKGMAKKLAKGKKATSKAPEEPFNQISKALNHCEVSFYKLFISCYDLFTKFLYMFIHVLYVFYTIVC